MRDILDPKGAWLGTPVGGESFGNKRPVALDDTLAVLTNSGPVSVDVLANDFDPEGGPLSLISASAALGTAVAEPDDTVTYTPPPGTSGFDTVVYEIADDQNQVRTAQINVTISDPELTITTLPDNTLTVTAEMGALEITLGAPPAFAGGYQRNMDDLVGGPINLAPPVLTGTVSTGQVLTALDGLWINDTTAGVPVQSHQWYRGGAEIPGATGATYTVQAGDFGPGISVAEIQTDTFGQRQATSATSGVAFIPSDDAALVGWWDAADAATITDSAGAVSAWASKAGGAALEQLNTVRQPVTGSRSLNGLNIVDFAGDRFLDRPITLPKSGNVAVHMVLVIDGVSSQYDAPIAFDAANDVQIDAGHDTQFDGRLNAIGIGSTSGFSGGPFSGPLILSMVLDFSGAGEGQVFIGNIQRATTAYTTQLDTSQVLHLMANRSKNAFQDGAVAELIVTEDVTNRAAHHSYLSGKWGLT